MMAIMTNTMTKSTTATCSKGREEGGRLTNNNIGGKIAMVFKI